MGKRSSFVRHKNDLYRTFDPRAVAALAPHLEPNTLYAEPCAGRGDLIDLLGALGHICIYAADIEPGASWIPQADALLVPPPSVTIITNPPWTRRILHALLERWPYIAPTWLLFDMDWVSTKQARPYLHMCVKIVTVGRLKWIVDSPFDAKDNCAWYLFDAAHDGSPPLFYGR
jgi:hypothetical protein